MLHLLLNPKSRNQKLHLISKEKTHSSHLKHFLLLITLLLTNLAYVFSFPSSSFKSSSSSLSAPFLYPHTTAASTSLLPSAPDTTNTLTKPSPPSPPQPPLPAQ
jgi:hypothetical protein